MNDTRQAVGVIGTGLIGRGWAIVFARAGYDVRMYDAQPGACESALRDIHQRLLDLERYGLISEPHEIASRLKPVSSLAEAVCDVELVQECTLETLADKCAIFEEVDRAAAQHTMLASSSSGIVASAFTQTLPGRERCLVAHPANPPYLIPLVEIVPAPWTRPDVVARATAFYAAAGQVPIVVRRELEGFILNRLQGALLNEAFRLVEDGYVDSEAIDKTVSCGLGLRWAFMGPFETIDLNAPGGIADYAQRYGPLYYNIAKSQAEPRPWDEQLIRRVETERRDVLPAARLRERAAWRDRRLMLLAAHKAQADRTVEEHE